MTSTYMERQEKVGQKSHLIVNIKQQWIYVESNQNVHVYHRDPEGCPVLTAELIQI